MSHNNETLSHIIEHLGLALVSSLPTLAKSAGDADEEAEIMAKLLTSSVDLGVAISSKMNVPSDMAKAEALRFKLTAISAAALSERIRANKKEPAQSDIDSLKASIDSLIVFSRNFDFDEAGISYLNQIGLQKAASKETPQFLTIEALLPVISVIDHKDRGIFENVASRLIRESEDLSTKYQDTGSVELSPILKHKFFALLCRVFAGIYPRLMREKKSLGDVWQEFDRQRDLVLVIFEYLMPNIAKTKDTDKSEAAAGKVTPVNAPVKQTSQPNDSVTTPDKEDLPEVGGVKTEVPKSAEPQKVSLDIAPPKEETKPAEVKKAPVESPLSIFGKKKEDSAPTQPVQAQKEDIVPPKAQQPNDPPKPAIEKPSIFSAPKQEKSSQEIEKKSEDADDTSQEEKPLDTPAKDIPKEDVVELAEPVKVKKPAMPPPPPMTPEEEAYIAELKRQRAEAAKAAADEKARKAENLKRNPPPVMPATPDRGARPQELPDKLVEDDVFIDEDDAEQVDDSDERNGRSESSGGGAKPNAPSKNDSAPLSYFKKP